MFFEGADGMYLFYEEWLGANEDNILIHLHGVESHSEWFSPVAEQLNRIGYTVYAVDRRGCGKNMTKRECTSSFELLVEDVKLFIDHVRFEGHRKKVHLIAVSWGAR